MTILVCDDDKEIVDAIEIYLIQEGYQVVKAYDGEQALDMLRTKKIDLMVIDVMMPKLDGIRATFQARKTSSIPIIILSAKTEDADKILGLNVGADDYITKPFAIEELLARIRAALRKRAVHTGSILTAGELAMDVERHQVSVRGQSVELTKKEFDLLHQLLENKGRVLTREALLDSVWGFDFVGETNSVDVYIRFLRSKIDEAFGIKLIHTVRGVGYVIRES